MIAYAAIDLRGGEVVQLVGGRPEAERVRVRDPVGVARRWVEAGFRALHVVDLDAVLATAPAKREAADSRELDSPASPTRIRPDAVERTARPHAQLGSPASPTHTRSDEAERVLRPPLQLGSAASPTHVPPNQSERTARSPAQLDPAAPHCPRSTASRVEGVERGAQHQWAETSFATTLQIKHILEAVDVPVQVGGGVRDDGVAAELLEAGAARVVVGTRAVEEPAWLETLARRHPRRIVMAADVRGEYVVTRGWTATTELVLEAVLERVESLPIAGILVTDVTREGRMSGIDARRFGTLVARTRHPIIASGGVASLDDLRALAARGVAGAVLGMALYTEAIDAATVAAEFAV